MIHIAGIAPVISYPVNNIHFYKMLDTGWIDEIV